MSVRIDRIEAELTEQPQPANPPVQDQQAAQGPEAADVEALLRRLAERQARRRTE
jgi:hypothetical protein